MLLRPTPSPASSRSDQLFSGPPFRPACDRSYQLSIAVSAMLAWVLDCTATMYCELLLVPPLGPNAAYCPVCARDGAWLADQPALSAGRARLCRSAYRNRGDR